MAAICMAVLLLLFITEHAAGTVDPQPPKLFIFGDSTADVGTNDYLPTSTFKANFPHNGVDFPDSKPTGRFCNGYITPDFLAMFLGHKESPPPFLSIKNLAQAVQTDFFAGINFASGGSGILQTTGKSPVTMTSQGNVITLREQIEQFSLVRGYLPGIGVNEISNAIFMISVGSNDLFSYYDSDKSITKEEFLWALTRIYSDYIKRLIGLGARKLAIVSVGQIGCVPIQRIKNDNGDCVEELNDLSESLDQKISLTLLGIKSEYNQVKYSFGNAFPMTANTTETLQTIFKDIKGACCGDGKLNAETICMQNSSLCENRTDYLFWDQYHPTQAANKLAAQTLFSGGQKFVSPMNISQLAQA